MPWNNLRYKPVSYLIYILHMNPKLKVEYDFYLYYRLIEWRTSNGGSDI